MSILWAEDFQGYGSGAPGNVIMLDGAYASVGSGQVKADPDPNAPEGTLCWYSNQGANYNTALRWVLPAAEITVGAACRWWLDNIPIGTERFYPIAWSGGSNGFNCGIAATTEGAIEFVIHDLNGNKVVKATSDPLAVVAHAWQHIEMKVTANTWTDPEPPADPAPNADGSVEVRVNGITVISVTDIQTTSVPIAGSYSTFTAYRQDVNPQYPTYSATGYIKDLVIWNTAGEHNNDFFGAVSVFRLKTLADVDLGGWTLTGGAVGAEILADTPPDDAKFLSAAVPPVDPASFTMDDLPADVSSVRGIVTVVRARKLDGGDGDLQVSLLSGGDAADGTNRPITSAFTYWHDVSEEDPATGASWSVAGVNAATIQINRTV